MYKHTKNEYEIMKVIETIAKIMCTVENPIQIGRIGISIADALTDKLYKFCIVSCVLEHWFYRMHASIIIHVLYLYMYLLFK